MPASAAAAGVSLQPSPANAPSPASPPAPTDGLREALLARVRTAAASEWAFRDADLAAEAAALEAADECAVPSEAELAGLAPDPLAGPPDGKHEWLADLPGPLLDEYLAATAEPVGPEPLPAGLWNRAAGNGGGFAAGGVADDLPPGPVLAGLTSDVHAAGLGRIAGCALMVIGIALVSLF